MGIAIPVVFFCGILLCQIIPKGKNRVELARITQWCLSGTYSCLSILALGLCLATWMATRAPQGACVGRHPNG